MSKTTSLICVLIMASLGWAQSPAVKKIEAIQSSTDGWQWKVTFDTNVKVADIRPAVTFIKVTTTGTIFDGKEAVKIDGKEAIVTLGVKAFAKGAPRLSILELKVKGSFTAQYEVQVSPMLLKKTAKEFSDAVASLDEAQRSHDGTATFVTKTNQQSDGITVTLTYASAYGKR